VCILFLVLVGGVGPEVMRNEFGAAFPEAAAVPGRVGHEEVQTLLVEQVAARHDHRGQVFVLHVELEFVLTDLDFAALKDRFAALHTVFVEQLHKLVENVVVNVFQAVVEGVVPDDTLGQFLV